MSTISTIFHLANHAKQGKTIKDKWLAFLIAGLGVIGHHRHKIRQLFIKQIELLSHKDSLKVKLWINQKLSSFSMRKGNEADYLIGFATKTWL